MARYKVNTERLQSESSSLYDAKRELSRIQSRLASVRLSSALNSWSVTTLQSRISNCATAAGNQAENMRKLAAALEDISRMYEQTEKQLRSPSGAETPGEGIREMEEFWYESIYRIYDYALIAPLLFRVTSFIFSGNWGIGLLSAATTSPLLIGIGAVLGSTGGNGGTEGNSLLSGGVSGNGTFLGIPCAGTAGYSLVGYETENTWEISWDLEEDDVGIAIGRETSGYLARGEASGNVGLLGGEIEGSVGNVSASGEVGVTLYEDGVFSPAINAEIRAEASAAEGSAEGYIGTENTNVHVNGEGTLFGAEAYAQGAIGVITETDELTGTTTTSYGVKGEVGAEAYLAEGEVSGGITIFGVDIDVGVSGKAGGVGATAGGSVTTDGVSGEVGLGLGLGLGLEISIDWSDFELPDLKWW